MTVLVHTFRDDYFPVFRRFSSDCTISHICCFLLIRHFQVIVLVTYFLVIVLFHLICYDSTVALFSGDCALSPYLLRFDCCVSFTFSFFFVRYFPMVVFSFSYTLQPPHYIGPTNPACNHLAVFRSAPEDTSQETRGVVPPPTSPDLRVGDCVCYFAQNSVFGDTTFLRWARIYSIEETDSEPDVKATSVDGVHYQNRVAVYRLDHSGTFVDVTNGLFMFMSNMTLHYGTMRPGCYFTDCNATRNKIRNYQISVNDSLAASTNFKEESVPVLDPSVTIQDTVLRDVMDRVTAQHVSNLKASYALLPSSPSSPFYSPPKPSSPDPLSDADLESYAAMAPVQHTTALQFWEQAAHILRSKIDSSTGDDNAHASVLAQFQKTPVSISLLARTLSMGPETSFYDHPDADILHYIQVFASYLEANTHLIPRPIDWLASPSPVSLSSHENSKRLLESVFNASDGSKRGMIVLMPHLMVDELSGLLDSHVTKARPIHSQYKPLHQFIPGDSFPHKLKTDMEDFIALALQSIGYNKNKSGVILTPTYLYSNLHAKQPAHADSNPTEITRVRNTAFINTVSFFLLMPGGPHGCTITLWPELDDACGKAYSVVVHLKRGQALLFRADMKHAGTFARVDGVLVDLRRLHGKVVQVGGSPKDLQVVNYYDDEHRISFSQTHLYRDEHSLMFGEQTSQRIVGGHRVTDNVEAVPLNSFPSDGPFNVPSVPHSMIHRLGPPSAHLPPSDDALTPRACNPASSNDSASRSLESTSKNLIEEFNTKSNSSKKSSAPGNLLDSDERRESPAPRPTPAPGPTAGTAAPDASPTAGPDTGAPPTTAPGPTAGAASPDVSPAPDPATAPTLTPDPDPNSAATKPTAVPDTSSASKPGELYAASATSQHTTTSTAHPVPAGTHKSSSSDEFEAHAPLGFPGLFDDVEDIIGTNNTVDNGDDDNDDDAFMAKIHNKVNEGLPTKKKYKENYDVEYDTVPSPDPHMHPQTLRSIPLHLYDVVGKPSNFNLKYLMRHKFCSYPWALYANCRVMRGRCFMLAPFRTLRRNYDNYVLRHLFRLLYRQTQRKIEGVES